MRKVFERFRTFDIKISAKKFKEITRSSITFLGHEITKSSYCPGTRNVKAILDCPAPKTAKEVKRFVGMANFFRKFIPHFAKTAAPLNDLTKEGSAFAWTSTHQKAFESLKTSLSSKRCLAFPQDKDFILHTDGSQIAVGAVLMQEQTESKTDIAVIGYFSKTLSESQRRRSPTHIGLFAMISALRFFKNIIYGNRTHILSDHRPLTYLLKHNKTHDNLARWTVELQSYNISIDYLKGSSNVIADYLSRISYPSQAFQDDHPESEDIVEFPYCLSVNPLDLPIIAINMPTAIKPYDFLIEQKKR
ncbi:unnamed protein product [Cylicostephanus goldi]|uniref:Reverse transcriptase RNase H-like domain-containing protein n=1 Tax=Cylicostephanus goldi TaxID=71465 RepID=A0A3P6TBK8_CYLGO|nr:unnamed protein product [Cylicostephanus goldi]